MATAAAVPMLNLSALEAMSGSPVRVDYSTAPAASHIRNSAADAVIIAPAAFNTINKLAAGINDTYPLSVVAEAIGRGTPVIVLPSVNSALALRRPFLDAVSSLRAEGVTVILGPDRWMPHPPGSGAGPSAEFPWASALRSVDLS